MVLKSTTEMLGLNGMVPPPWTVEMASNEPVSMRKSVSGWEKENSGKRVLRVGVLMLMEESMR